MAPGVFYGVGIGPGDPELITLKAARVLARVERIFVPAGGKSAGSFAGRIVASLNLPEDKFRTVSLCMGRDRRADQGAYARAAAAIAEEVGAGLSAAWITEGDPLFYSTFLHVYGEMRGRYPHVRIEIIPGVTSLQAAAARAGKAVAYLDDRVAVIPAAYGLERLPGLLREFATVFLIKVAGVFDQLLECLPPGSDAVYLENVGTPQERIVTDLPSLRGQDLPYFSLVMVRSARPLAWDPEEENSP